MYSPCLISVSLFSIRSLHRGMSPAWELPLLAAQTLVGSSLTPWSHSRLWKPFALRLQNTVPGRRNADAGMR